MLEPTRQAPVSLFIHIPYRGKDQSQLILERMETLFNICIRPFSPESKEWMISDDDASSMHVWKASPESREPWPEKSKLNDASVKARCQATSTKKGYINGFALVRRSDRCTSPMIKDERRIEIDIAGTLWSEIDHACFFDAITDTCCVLGATYACIDLGMLCFHASMYTIGFRYFGKNPEKIDLETRLPGIYWAQFIAPELVKNTGMLEEIVDLVPCATAQIVERYGFKGLWVQLPKNPHKVKHEDRLALRWFFSQSLYELSFDAIVNVIPYFQMMSEKLPLTLEEISQVEEARRLQPERKRRIDYWS